MTAEPDILDVEAQHRLNTELGLMRIPNLPEAVMRASAGVGGRGIISRCLRTLRGPGRLTMHEFIYHGLHDPAIATDELPRFLGARMRHKQTASVNSRDWAAPTFDKLLWDTILRGADLPRPTLRASYGPGRPSAGIEWLPNRDAVLAFLRQPANYPLFGKPNGGGRSLGVLALRELDGDDVLLQRGASRPVEQVADFITRYSAKGFLFQDILAPHPAIAELTGGTLATARVFLLVDPERVRIENITLKIPRADAIVDNFWRGGNMLGAIDPDTGAVVRVVSGSGLERVELAEHPDTGRNFHGFVLPDIAALKDLCTDAAPVFPELPLQGWDIAFTERGPVPVELNFGGDVNLQQLAHRAGAMTPAYCAHLRRLGYTGPLPD